MTQNTNGNTETGIVTTQEQQNTPAHLNQSLVQAQSTDLALIKQKAQLLLESRMLPTQLDTWQKIAVVMIRGRELDVPDMVALQHIFVVKGTTNVDGQLMLALLERSGLLEQFEIVESTNDKCSLLVKRAGRKAMVYTCTRADAAGLKMKDDDKWTSLVDTTMWKAIPRVKLFLFTVKAMSRALFSDVINGMAGNKAAALVLRDEYDDTVDYGEVVAEAEAPLSVSVSEPNAEPLAHGVYPDSEEGEIVEEVQYESPAPQIGNLNMAALLTRAEKAGLVMNQFHFDNLIRKLQSTGAVTDKMTGDKVIDAIRKYNAEKDMEGSQ